MATAEELARDVRTQISDQSANPATVNTLRTLLDCSQVASHERLDKIGESQRNVPTSTRGSKGRKATPSTRLDLKSTKPGQAVRIHEDETSKLPPRARYALAVAVVNEALTVVTGAAKRFKALQSDVTSAQDGSTGSITPIRPALADLSVQPSNTSPSRRSLAKGAASQRSLYSCSRDGVRSDQAYVAAVAECARLAIRTLRLADASALKVKPQPALQVELGALALAEKLIALGYDEIAVRELRMIKRRLSSLSPQDTTCKPVVESQDKAQESPATLLDLNLDIEAHPELLPLLISYKISVLQIIRHSNRPAIAEEAYDFLSMENAASLANLILKNIQEPKSRDKSLAQVEVFCKLLTGMCPPTAMDADKIALQSAKSISPVCAFKYQVLSLKIRHRVETTSESYARASSKIATTLPQCLRALERRVRSSVDPQVLYKTVLNACTSFSVNLYTTNSCPELLDIRLEMSTFAEKASLYDQAYRWAESNRQSQDVDYGQHLVALTRKVTLALCYQSIPSAIHPAVVDLLRLQDALKETPNRKPQDVDRILANLAVFAEWLRRHRSEVNDLQLDLVRSAADFASRSVRLYGVRHLEPSLAIIHVALSQISVKETIRWVSHDSARVLILSHALQDVTSLLASGPLTEAWSSSRQAIALDRILKALVLKAANAVCDKSKATICDEEKLPLDERGALLEWQVRCALDLAAQSKYTSALQKMVPELLRRLSQSYTAAAHPVRRLRVLFFLLRVRDQYPDVIPPHALKAYLDQLHIDHDRLGHDEGLRPYLCEIEASVQVYQALSSGTPTLPQLQQPLMVWQKLLFSTHAPGDLKTVIDDHTALHSLLMSLDDYFFVVGEGKAQVPIARMLVRLCRIGTSSEKERCDASIRLARAYLALGYAEQAGEALGNIAASDDVKSGVLALQYHLSHADLFLALDDLKRCQQALREGLRIRAEIDPRTVPSVEVKNFRLLHGRAWLLQSRYLLAAGASYDAIFAGKRAIRILNKIWTSMEGNTGLHASESRPSDLVSGISRLQLQPNEPGHNPKQGTTSRGSMYWALLPLLCSALTHLSAVYAHNGSFSDAKFYSEQAVKVSDCSGLPSSFSWPRHQHSMLLVSAGRLAEAELCLAKNARADLTSQALTAVATLRLKAILQMKEGGISESLELLQKAKRVTDTLKSPEHLLYVESFHADDSTVHDDSRGKPTHVSSGRSEVAASDRPSKSTKPTKSKSATRSKSVKAPAAVTLEQDRACYVIQKIEAQVLLSQAVAGLRLGRGTDETLARVVHSCDALKASSMWRQTEHRVKMQQAMETLSADLSFSMLSESSLSIPALLSTSRKAKTTVAKASTSKTTSSRGVRQGDEPRTELERLLSAAKACVAAEGTDELGRSTTDAHAEYSLLSSAMLLLAAITPSSSANLPRAPSAAQAIEYPRMHAMECHFDMAECDSLERQSNQSMDPLAWPDADQRRDEHPFLASSFQLEYVDVLPKAWTAVSLSLNESCDELYVVRYRRAKTPLILRLPLTRHQAEEEDGDRFDFPAGRAELQDIIELSNSTCQNTVDPSAKNVKSTWWNQREALDKRLHELLINMENIWLGGFKGALSQNPIDAAQLPRFRRAVDTALGNHLPSRKALKRDPKRLELDDQILELFLSLGSDHEESGDLDEPLSDLLYFVVDMLQFNGEQNAYDEVDFDRMALEVLDAMRDYHQAVEEQEAVDTHMVLVLDRRLQAFPWESLPCLDGASVSRVDSMLSLRERLLTMSECRGESSRRGCNEDRYVVPRHAGNYILNPSGDLANTETTLGPVLLALQDGESSEWKSIVNRKPTEDEFKAALAVSTMLYFGHGSGTQYIRSSAIRKLERCSEVVWLMGCSSGAFTEYDELEPFAVPLEYMTTARKGTGSQSAGSEADCGRKCMTVLATLWDVTDRDIDRFSLAVGNDWGLWTAPAGSSKLSSRALKRRDASQVPLTPQRQMLAPKTPKAHKTPARSHTPARKSRPQQTERGKSSLAKSVAVNRDACYLRYLNGAAPVVFGIPVYLGD